MANELYYREEGLTGSTLYVVLWNEDGNAWNGSAFAAYTTTRGDFDISSSENGATGYWLASMPAVAAGNYRWAWYLRAGGSPSHDNDIELATGDGYWNGSDFGAAANITLSSGDITTIATEVVTALADEGSGVSAFVIDKSHMWWFEHGGDLTAANTIYELFTTSAEAGFNVLLRMDLTEPLPEGTSIRSVVAVDIQPTGLILVSRAVSPDHLKADIQLSSTGTALPQQGMYNVAITVRTEDSQDMTRQGRLYLRTTGT